MLMRPLMFRGAAGGGAPVLKPQDVHATTLYTGNGANRSVTTGLDLTKGGVLKLKSRSNNSGHVIVNSLRGANKFTDSSTSDAEQAVGDLVTALTNTGFNLGSDGNYLYGNVSGRTYVAQTDLQAPKYLQIRTFTHASGTADTFDMAVLGIVGEVTIKRTDAAGDWFVWHRSIAAGNNLRLNTTAVPSSTDAFVSVSGTTVTFSADAPSGSYYFEAWAHDPDTTSGIVQCGSFPGNGSGQGATLGWQPQLVQWKRLNVAESWNISDVQRGFGPAFILSPNLSAAEPSANNGNLVVSSTGFYLTGGGSGPYAFRAIRAAY